MKKRKRMERKRGLFNEIKCVHCGEKTGLMTRTKLSDGQYICSKCSSGIPLSVSGRLKEYDYDGFIRLKEYVEYSNNELSKIFRETHSFYSIHIDTEHKLFYFAKDSPYVYYKFEEISEFDLDFIADEGSSDDTGYAQKINAAYDVLKMYTK